MSRRIPFLAATVLVFMLITLAGCGSNADLSLKFSPDDTDTYKVVTRAIKDYRFEQPSLNPPKLDEQQSGPTIGVTFDQTIQDVAEDGSAVANITIKEVSYLIKDKSDVKFDFDSQRAADKSKAFAKVIGQSYKIRISPEGSVETVDAKAARAAVGAGYEGQIAKAFFSDIRIKARHEILALPDADASTLKKKASWSRVVASPAGMLAAKSFEKVYTLTSIEGPKNDKTATVEMVASESAEAAEGASKKAGGMGIFANMFDTEEVYTGRLVMSVGTGKVKEYNEKLVATYPAAEESKDEGSDKGPDTLKMSFTYAVSAELID